MIAVPAAAPVTTPSVTVVEEVLLLHVPPVMALVNVVVADGQTDGIPVIMPASGKGLIVICIVSKAVPHMLVTL